MRLVWHIYKKDVRHLWWEVSVVTGLLAWFVHLDSWRADTTVSPVEGWLNVLLPLAWAYVIALAVLDDPLEGDRQYWVALPLSWQRLLWAKVLFALSAVHIPYFAGTCVILLVRGFAPWEYLPGLLWKQAVLGAVLTLPAIALASVSKSITQFMMIAIAAAAGLIALVRPEYTGFMPPAAEDVRRVLAAVVLTAGLTPIVWTQYQRRLMRVARVAVCGAVVAAAGVYASVSSGTALVLRCRLQPTGVNARIELAPPRVFDPQQERLTWYFDRISAAVPVRITGLPNDRWSLWQTSFEIRTTSETIVPSEERFDPRRPFASPPLRAELWPRLHGQGWEVVRAAPDMFRKLSAGPVTLAGRSIVRPLRAVGGRGFRLLEPSLVADVGRCSSRMLPLGMGHAMLQVNCESPDPLPIQALVSVTSIDGCREWHGSMYSGGFRPFATAGSWLSPVNRSSAYFQTGSPDPVSGFGQYMIPPDELGGATVRVEARIPTTCDVIDYELSGVRLSDYVVRPR